MRFTFLGTGAADWETPIETGEFRRYTSTLINDDLLIDGTESVSDALPMLTNVEAMIFTHSHSDHFEASFLSKVAPAEAFAERSWATENHMQPVDAGRAFTAAGYELMPVPSNHSTQRTDEQTLNYIISDGEKRVLYATDGAWLTNAAYHAIKSGAPLDAIIFDGTIGDDYPDDWRVFEHNSLHMVRQMRASLIQMKCLRASAPVFVTHLARTLHPSQQELEAREASSAHPLIICCDGMRAEI